MNAYLKSKKFNPSIFSFFINKLNDNIKDNCTKIKDELFNYYNTGCEHDINKCDINSLNTILNKIDVEKVKNFYNYIVIYDTCLFNFFQVKPDDKIDIFPIYIAKVILKI